MADVKTNVAKGFEGYYFSLPAAADSIIAVPIETGHGLADGTFADFTTLAALLASAANEQGTMGRQTLTGVTSTVSGSGTTGKRVLDADNITFVGASGAATSKLAICYKPDTASVDADIVPIFVLDFAATPTGGNLTAAIDAAGLADLT